MYKVDFWNILTKFAAKIIILDMKRKFFPLTLLLAGVFMLASCLGDDTDNSDITYYGDAAITSFSLGTLNKYYLYNNGDTIKKNEDGTDSTTTVDCSTYKMTIDQLKHEIYNVDSLPAGVDAKKVVCTVASKNSGIIVVKKINNDSLDYYNSADSMDLSVPRQFRVYSTDGTNYRKYNVTVNVHKELPDSFVWHKQSMTESATGLNNVSGVNTFAMGNTLYTAISDAAGTYIAAKNIDNDSEPWRVLVSNMNMVFSKDAYKNIAVLNGWIYILNDGKMFKAQDGSTWQPVTTSGLNNPKQLVGAGSTKMYAVTATGIASSADGNNWTETSVDGEISKLPSNNAHICSLPLKTNSGVERIVMIGNSDIASDTTAVVLGKIEDSKESVDSYSWSLYEGGYKLMLPNMQGLSVMKYDGKLYAIGGSGLNGSKVQPYSKLYCSKDQGLTWQTSSLFTLPKDLPTDVDANTISMTADKENHVWIVCAKTGQVWKMRINRLGWKTVQKSFNE